jgi:carboxymethylenebutenolidase
VQELHGHEGPRTTEGHGKVGFVGFSLGGSYALDMSVNLADEVAAVVIFYAAWAGPDFGRAKASYLCHFAEDDPFEETGSAAEMERAMQAAARPVHCYRYRGTKHWFFEDNCPEYDANAAGLAWKRTVEFLHQHLD